MVKEETREFVRKNRGLLREVAARKKSPIAPLAAAMLISVEPEDEENESSEEEPQVDPDTGTAGLDEILEKGVEH